MIVSQVLAALASGVGSLAGAVLGHRLVFGRYHGSSAALRWERTNHAGRTVTLLEGPVAVAATLAGLGLARALERPTGARSAALCIAIAGAGIVGAYDDLYGTAQAKGFRGHLRALRQRRITSGMIKIAGIGLSAGAAALILERDRARTDSGGRWPGRRSRGLDLVLDTCLIAGTANLVNLLDLRPGRAGKAVSLLALGLVGSGAAPVVGAALGSLPFDLAEKSMLGDCGANALGAGVGAAAASALPRSLRIWSLAGVALLNLASERVSFSAVIDRCPPLRRLDQFGRLPAATARHQYMRGSGATSSPTGEVCG